MLSHNLASLHNLWIQKCRKLKSLSMSLAIQHVTSLKLLEIRDCKEIDLFSEDGTQCVNATTLQSLIISKVPHLITLHHFKGLKFTNTALRYHFPKGLATLHSFKTFKFMNDTIWYHFLKKWVASPLYKPDNLWLSPLERKIPRENWQGLDCSCPTCSHIFNSRIKFLFSNQNASTSLGRYYNSTCTFFAIKNTTFFLPLMPTSLSLILMFVANFNLLVFSKHYSNNWKGAKESWEDCLKLLKWMNLIFQIFWYE